MYAILTKQIACYFLKRIVTFLVKARVYATAHCRKTHDFYRKRIIRERRRRTGLGGVSLSRSRLTTSKKISIFVAMAHSAYSEDEEKTASSGWRFIRQRGICEKELPGHGNAISELRKERSKPGNSLSLHHIALLCRASAVFAGPGTETPRNGAALKCPLSEVSTK